MTRRKLVTLTQCHEKERRETAMPGPDVPCSGQKEKARASATLVDAGGVLRQRDEVKAMAASGTIARASLL